MLLTEALGWFYLSMSGVLAPSTERFYKNRLRSLSACLGERDLSTITINDLRAWRLTLTSRTTRYVDDKYHHAQQGKLSANYIDQHVRAVKRFFNWCLDEGYLEINPARRLERPPLPIEHRRGIPAKDRDRILKAARSNVRDFAIIRILADSACRIAGVTGLRLQDLDLDNHRAVVHEKGRGGNKKARLIRFNPKTVAALKAWLDLRSFLILKTDRVFVGKSNGRPWRPLTESGIYQIVERTAEKAGVENGWNPHNWRHGAIRGWLNRGMPLSKASQLAGHSSTKVTGDIYGTSNDNELDEAHEKWGWEG